MSKQTAGCNSVRLFSFSPEKRSPDPGPLFIPHSTFLFSQLGSVLRIMTEFLCFMDDSIFFIDNIHCLCYDVKKVLTVRYGFFK